MAINITRVQGKYTATTTAPHGSSNVWQTEEPLTAADLIDMLRRRGCHQTDIGDAMYEADPEWLLRIESE
jgi:hypothetical protein